MVEIADSQVVLYYPPLSIFGQTIEAGGVQSVQLCCKVLQAVQPQAVANTKRPSLVGKFSCAQRLTALLGTLSPASLTKRFVAKSCFQ